MNTIEDFEELTVTSLFALSPENPAELAVGLDDNRFQAIADSAMSLAEPVAWTKIRNGLAGAMADALKTKLLGAWVAAWHDCQEVQEKAEKSSNSPDTPFSCTLLEHSIESSLHPYVKVFLGQKLIQQVDFDVTLETEIDGVILNLKGGSIVSIQAGQCQWSGSIAIEGSELIRRDLAHLDLPGRIVLKRPIALAAPNKLADKPS